MNSMIEKVSLALKEEFKRTIEEISDVPFPQTGVTIPSDRVWNSYARAAIEAMREPSKEMVSAGYEKINENIDFWNYESDSGYSVEDIAPSETWRAMIDAGLGE